MKNQTRILPKLLLLLGIGLASTATVRGQGTAISYLGRLNTSAGPANGIYDIRFTLYDSTNSPGVIIAGPLTNSAITISQGLFNAILDFGPGVFTGQQRWLELDVRTNGAAVFTPLSPRQAVVSVPYSIMAGSSSNLLGNVAVAQINGYLPATQVTGTVSVAQLPGVVLTNGASGVSLTGAFAGDGSRLTNMNNPMANSPYTYSQLNPAYGLWTTALDGHTVPFYSISQDYDSPNLDGTVCTWGYNLTGDLTYNAGRFIGASWNWEQQYPGADIRSMVLKGAASQTPSDGAYFILETRASSATPGNHGLFNNSLYVSRKGLMALGNLTDAADYNSTLPIEPYLTGWVNIFPSGSSWPHSAVTLPPLVINSQPLVTTPVANSVENNGSNWYLTDGSGNRSKVLTTGITNVIYAHVNGTNVFFSTQP